MAYTAEDLAHSENLIRALKKGTFELDGMEVIALAEVFKWVNRLHSAIEAEVNAPRFKQPVDVKVKRQKGV